jgi:hypothetical protein
MTLLVARPRDQRDSRTQIVYGGLAEFPHAPAEPAAFHTRSCKFARQIGVAARGQPPVYC